MNEKCSVLSDVISSKMNSASQVISLTMPLQCKILKQILENVQLLPKFLGYALKDEFPSFTVSEP